MKLAVFLGGPFHGTIRWVERFPDTHEFDTITDLPFSDGQPLTEENHNREIYRFAFGDEYIGIYYWRLNDFQVKAVRQQVVQLRARHGEIAEVHE